jgi:hypothetical protein
MAVVSTPQGSTLRLRVQTGEDGSGNPVYRNRSYNKVKSAATDQDVFEVALALSGLQAHTLVRVIRLDEEDLAEQG